MTRNINPNRITSIDRFHLRRQNKPIPIPTMAVEATFEEKKAIAIKSRQDYLISTDGDFISAMDRGLKNYPEKAPRQKARAEKSLIETFTDISELEDFDIIFNPEIE